MGGGFDLHCRGMERMLHEAMHASGNPNDPPQGTVQPQPPIRGARASAPCVHLPAPVAGRGQEDDALHEGPSLLAGWLLRPQRPR